MCHNSAFRRAIVAAVVELIDAEADTSAMRDVVETHLGRDLTDAESAAMADEIHRLVRSIQKAEPCPT